MTETFGQAFGNLIREKRGQEGLTQRELAIQAFDDESKVRRILELENGQVKRPQAKTIDPLLVYFGITTEELERCRQKPFFTEKEQTNFDLSRELIENLAVRFDHGNPNASDDELIENLKNKAEELRSLQERLSQIEKTTTTLDNQIATARAEIELGHFEEADNLLATAEELQQEERTLKEVRIQSEIRSARGDTALLSGDSSLAVEHYKKSSGYLYGFDKNESANLLSVFGGRIYEIERRRISPDFLGAIQLLEECVRLVENENEPIAVAQRKYQLALLCANQGRLDREKYASLLDLAISNSNDALKLLENGKNDFEWASCMVNLANAHLDRGKLKSNKNRKMDIDLSIEYYNKILSNPLSEKLHMHRAHIFNNMAHAHRLMTMNTNQDKNLISIRKAKKLTRRAIEISTEESELDIWVASQHNLGSILCEEAELLDPNEGTFLRIQAVCAFQSAQEAFPHTGFESQTAESHLCMAHALAELGYFSKDGALREAYFARALRSYNACCHIFTPEEHPNRWAEAHLSAAKVFALHAEECDRESAISDLEQALELLAVAYDCIVKQGVEDPRTKCDKVRNRIEERLKELQRE